MRIQKTTQNLFKLIAILVIAQNVTNTWNAFPWGSTVPYFDLDTDITGTNSYFSGVSTETSIQPPTGTVRWWHKLNNDALPNMPNPSAAAGCSKYLRATFESSFYMICNQKDIYFGFVDVWLRNWKPDFTTKPVQTIAAATSCHDLSINERDLFLFVSCKDASGAIIISAIDMRDFTIKTTSSSFTPAQATGNFKIQAVEGDADKTHVYILSDDDTFKGDAFTYDRTGAGTFTTLKSFVVADFPLAGKTPIKFDYVGARLVVFYSEGATGALDYGYALCHIDSTPAILCPDMKKMTTSTLASAPFFEVTHIYEIDRGVSLVAAVNMVEGTTLSINSISTPSSPVIAAGISRLSNIPVTFTSVQTTHTLGLNFIIGVHNSKLYLTVLAGASIAHHYELKDFAPGDVVLPVRTTSEGLDYSLNGFKNNKVYYTRYENKFLEYRPRDMTTATETVTFAVRSTKLDGTFEDTNQVTFSAFKDYHDGLTLGVPKFFKIYTKEILNLPIAGGAATTGNGPSYTAENTGDVVAKIDHVVETTSVVDSTLSSATITDAFQLEKNHYMSKTVSGGNYHFFKCEIVAGTPVTMKCDNVYTINAAAYSNPTMMAADFWADKNQLGVVIQYGAAGSKQSVAIVVDIAASTERTFITAGEYVAYSIHGATIAAQGGDHFHVSRTKQVTLGVSDSSEVHDAVIKQTDATGATLTWSLLNIAANTFRLCLYRYEFFPGRTSHSFILGSDCKTGGGYEPYHYLIRSSFTVGSRLNLGTRRRSGSQKWGLTESAFHCDSQRDPDSLTSGENAVPFWITSYIHSTYRPPTRSSGGSIFVIEPINALHASTALIDVIAGKKGYLFATITEQGAGGPQFLSLFNSKQFLVDNRKRLHSSIPLPTHFNGNGVLMVKNDDESEILMFTPAGGFAKPIVYGFNGPQITLDATAATTAGTQDINIKLTNPDGTKEYGTATTGLTIYEPFTEGTITKRTDTELVLQESGEKTFDLDSFMTFSGPIININFNSASNGTNVLLQRQRVTPSKFTHLKTAFNGILNKGTSEITWGASSVSFFENTGSLVQTVTGTPIMSNFIETSTGTSYATIVDDAGTKKLTVNQKSGAAWTPIETSGIDQDITGLSSIETLNSGNNKFVLCYYALSSDGASELRFQEITINGSSLDVLPAVAQPLDGEIFHLETVNQNSMVFAVLSLKNREEIFFVATGESSGFKILGYDYAAVDLDQFRTTLQGSTSKISCIEGTATTIKCGISDSIFNVMLIDVTLEDSSTFGDDKLIKSAIGTDAFILPQGFDVQSLIREQDFVYWAGKRTTTAATKTTVLDQDYLLLLFGKGEGEHPIMTLQPKDTGVAVANFDKISSFFTFQEVVVTGSGENVERPVINFNTGEASATGSLGSILVDKFRWKVTDPASVDFSKDLFDVENYDPSKESTVVIDDVVTEDDANKPAADTESSTGIELFVALFAILLIVIFIVFCVYCSKKGAAGRKKKSNYSSAKSDQKNSQPLIGADN